LWQTSIKPKGIISLVHGLGEHSGRYNQWVEMLNNTGYSVIAPDLRGHGKSEGKRGHISSFDDYLMDNDLLLKETQQRFSGMPCFQYGHSLGAIIVWTYVLKRHPKLSGVVLSALDYRNALEEQKGKVLLAKLLGALLPSMTMSSGLDPNAISRDPAVVNEYINDPLVHKDVTLGFAKSSLEIIAWSLEHTSEWTLPVLVMHGEQDKLGYVIGSREFADKVSCDCTLKIWDGLSHEIHNEPEKEIVFEFLRNWLDSHLNGK
jgi:alpha-beta hydrolase superfamily lysophospholipase